MRGFEVFRSLCALWFLLLLTHGGVGAASAQEKCLPVTEQTKEALARYVHKRMKLPATFTVGVAEVSDVEGTCYRKVRFTAVGDGRASELELFLSPDRRFLTRDLADTRLDPDEEEAREAKRLSEGLTEGRFASRGPANAPVTIVIFSDFQCPFCKDSAGLLNQVAAAEGDKVRLVFRHLPLTSIHPWARTAAEAAACAQLQSDPAFWGLHDLIFENQRLITAANARAKISELARSVPALDADKFQRCVAEGASAAAIVSHDSRFAATHDIAATPTIFVNGKRAPGLRSVEQWRALVRQLTAPPADKTRPAAQ
jgi:protein-disulfide isomerase